MQPLPGASPALARLAACIQKANIIILKEAEDNCKHYNEYPEIQTVWTKRHFSDPDVEMLRGFAEATLPVQQNQMLRLLADETYLHLWSTAFICLFDHRGTDPSSFQWGEATRLAQDIVNIGDQAKAEAARVEYSLRSGNVLIAVSKKIEVLNIFGGISKTPTTAWSSPAAYVRGDPFPERLHARENRRLGAFWNARRFLVTVFVILTCTAGVIIAPAFKLLYEMQGSVRDPDFWVLIQTIIMIVLGVFITVYPAWSGAAPHLKFWVSLLASIAIGCAGASIVTYLRTRAFWSILLTFAGVAFQTFMVLLLALEIQV